ncbi:haloacid dehalogenase-like hydrolase superfamily protein [Striga asiatica]|uniref:Trehalose 6-phosphate phosphatase n=1 Tax=Striga asiatica TaxID=4170 RepID=A0A5A7Q501_STRAF|nr:haloacid dehalogenase-like hydrolase superfamily protein [Striga asiatica]
MVISDTKSGLTVALAIARPESILLSPNKRRLLKKLESTFENGLKINNLLDTMRASSPTRGPTDRIEDQNSWTILHPSALSKFDEIMKVSMGKQIVVFLDYDGTLSPIVDDPESAFMTAEVYNFVRLSELYYAGSHGMDIKGPSKGHTKGNQIILCQPATEFLPIIHEVEKSLSEEIKHIPGANIENNKFCLSVHYRCVEEKRWIELGDKVKLVMKDYQQLRLSQGRKVMEIRPMIKWDKGNALEFLLESLGFAESNDVFPVYIGDDRTDEDAFMVLRDRGQGLGILVSKGPKETKASYTLQEPLEASHAVMHFLNRLVEWHKRLKP